MKAFYVPEPYLFFKDGNACIDPKIGLLNYGPNGLNEENKEIEIGIIGTKSSKLFATQFLDRLQYEIDGKKSLRSNIIGVNFPGLTKDGPLGFYFTVKEEYCEIISDEVIKTVKDKSKTREEKIILAAKAFNQALYDLSGLHPKPDLVVISIPKEILTACKIPNQISDNIKLCNRNFETLKEIAEKTKTDWPPLIDFHHYLKVLGFEYNLKTQIVKPSTLNFASLDQDPATIAWNFTVACYYKSTGIPWKLGDLEKETIHVGISFYNDIGEKHNAIIRAAIAQVYMKTGDSQIVRGIGIPAPKEEDRRLNLTAKQAENILKKAISLYERQHKGQKPLRVVVHKKSNYTEEEVEGFNKAANGVEIKDYLYISDRPMFRALTPTEYPPARGTVFHHKTNTINELYIYTVGYIPCYNTYLGSDVPIPLRVILVSNQSSELQISKDIMNLTKLDWNSSNMARRLPVTIAVSEKVGEIMGEITITRRAIEIPTTYANYM